MTTIHGIITTVHRNPRSVAGALRPDNLSTMTTRVEGNQVVTVIEGLQLRSVIASVDDYLMNLAVAEEVCTCVSA
ncbi:MAG: hypothetical protein LUO82_00520 [Methanomicrobiales archaeon]|nr:hypothetical protein [Methanomicrobiales archaeon]